MASDRVLPCGLFSMSPALATLHAWPSDPQPRQEYTSPAPLGAGVPTPRASEQALSATFSLTREARLDSLWRGRLATASPHHRPKHLGLRDRG
jgi:hypothetical protein